MQMVQQPIAMEFVDVDVARSLKTVVPIVQEISKGQALYIEGRNEYQTIKKLPLKKPDQAKKWVEAINFRAENLENFVRGNLQLNYSRNDPLAQVASELIDSKDLLAYLIRDRLPELANSVLQPEGAVSAAEKNKLLKAAEKKMLEGRSIVEENLDGGYLEKSGVIKNDRLMNFYYSWCDRQAPLASGADYRKIDIRDCNELTKWAFKELQIAKHISPRASKLPFRPS